MKKYSLTIAIAGLLATIAWGSLWRYLLRSKMVLGVTTNVSAAEIMALTNLERTKAGKATLHPNSQLEEAALAKAVDMIERGYFDHIDPEGKGSWALIEGRGYSYQYAGENLARNFNTSEKVVEGWMRSEGHRENILKDVYLDIGVAVVETESEVYIVQLFAAPLTIDKANESSMAGKNFTFDTPLSVYRLAGKNTIVMGIFSLTATMVSLTILIKLMKMLKYNPLGKPSSEHWRKI